MIVSNFFDGQTALSDNPSEFYVVADGMQSYAKMAKEILSLDCNLGGSDHFISTMREISELEVIYDNCGLNDAIEKVEKTPGLRKWVAAILTIIMYGRDGGNSVEIASLPFNKDPYLHVWKNKFRQGDNDFGDVYEPNLNVYEFIPGDVNSIIGCFSKRYFIIPSREIIRNGEEWQNFYFSFAESDKGIYKIINSEATEIQRVILRLAAARMPENSVLRVIRGLLENVFLKDGNFDVNIELPYRTMNGLALFCTDPDAITEKPFIKDLYIFSTGREYFSLYPFADCFTTKMENGESFILKIKMEILRSGDDSINTIWVKSEIVYTVNFYEGDLTKSFSYTIEQAEKYGRKNIFKMTNLRTFCMYPDIPVEYEHRCNRYTFFSYENSYAGTLSGDYDCVNTAEMSPNIMYEIFGNEETDQLKADMNFSFSSSAKQRHVMKIRNAKGKYSGVIINVRTLDGIVPPFVTQEFSSAIRLRFEKKEAEKKKLCSYIDFGNDSTAIGYKTENGMLMSDNITGGAPIIRPLTSSFDCNERKYNLFNVEKVYRKIPSVLVKTANYRTDFAEHNIPFIPFTDDVEELENMRIPFAIDLKGDILSSDGENALAMMFNVCYIAVCNAIAQKCSSLFIFPTFPNEKYYTVMSSIWRIVTDRINKIFDIELINMIDCRNNFLLYEGVASIGNIQQTGSNVLCVNVNIGDMNTDMAAVFVIDETRNQKICSHSTLEYGGRSMLASAFANAMKKSENKKAAEIFLLGDDEKTGFLNVGGNDNLRRLVKSIALKFFPNSKRQGIPRSKKWNYYFSHILDLAAVNPDFDSPEEEFVKSVKANIIMRYVLLVPVIEAFIRKSLENCGANESTAINVKFCGNAAKGFSIIDGMLKNLFVKKIENYLRSSFTPRNVSLKISDSDSKNQVIKGLAEYTPSVDTDNIYYIGFAVNLNSDIVPTEHDDDVKVESTKFNRYISQTARKFINDTDILLACNEIFSNFNNSQIKYQLSSYGGNTSLTIAAESEIYPEMVQNAAYMFEAARILNETSGRK